MRRRMGHIFAVYIWRVSVYDGLEQISVDNISMKLKNYFMNVMVFC